MEVELGVPPFYVVDWGGELIPSAAKDGIFPV